TSERDTLALHVALPIWLRAAGCEADRFFARRVRAGCVTRTHPTLIPRARTGSPARSGARAPPSPIGRRWRKWMPLALAQRRLPRSEEHTSELQSREKLV